MEKGSGFPDPAQWRSSPFFFTPETLNDSSVSMNVISARFAAPLRLYPISSSVYWAKW
jgi:hypothetical protein